MDPYIGEVRLFAGNFAPAGWVLCNGAVLPISGYETLYTLIGTIYGGDGQSNFAVPDLRGRIPVSQGTGLGLTPRTIGSKFGVESVTLLQTQIPAHNHLFNATTATATAATPAGNTFAQPTDLVYTPLPTTTPDPQTLNATSVQNTGGSLPHNNIMSTTAINYIICTQGIFPSRN